MKHPLIGSGQHCSVKNKKYHGFLIDADNTIFDFTKAERDALFETLKSFSIMNYSEELYDIYHRINEELWRNFEEGTIDQSSLNIERFRLFLNSLNLNEDPEMIAALFLDRLSRKDYLLPHALEVLEFLSKRASLSLVSNGIARVQRGRIARAGIEIFFQDIIISEEVGFSKPDPEVFFLAISRLHLSLHNILCVGDSPSSDIRGANQAGLDTCWFMYPVRRYPPEEPKPDYIISDLRELLAFSPDLC